jgi:hypothetical protein
MDEIVEVSEGASGRRRHWTIVGKLQIVEQTLSSPLRSEAANAAEEVLVLLVLIKLRFLSPPYSNCYASAERSSCWTLRELMLLPRQLRHVPVEWRCFAGQLPTGRPASHWLINW